MVTPAESRETEGDQLLRSGRGVYRGVEEDEVRLHLLSHRGGRAEIEGGTLMHDSASRETDLVREHYEERPGVHGVTLCSADRTILRSVEPVIDAIARLFGSHCEVLLHSLEDLSNSVIKIANGHVTGRSLGAPVTDLAMRVLRDARSSQSDVVGPYTTRSGDGRTMRSVTSVVRGVTGRPIGFVCVNIDMSAPLLEVLTDLVGESLDVGETESSETFATSSEELVHRSVAELLGSIGPERQLSPVAKNKLIVRELLDRGIFDIRGAVDHVAREMGLSKYTIYNYLRELRGA